MRDQWRAEDDYRASARHEERGTDDRRQNSPAAPRREIDTGVGLKIRGRAGTDLTPGSPSRNRRLEKGESSRKYTGRESSRPSSRRRPKDEQPVKRPREASSERLSERPRYRDEAELANKRRRTRSRSSRPDISEIREDRRRPRSPIYSGPTDRFRPRSRSRSRRRERPLSPPRSSRSDYYSASYPEAGGLAGRFGDSYVPGSRRRPSPPKYLDHPSSRRRSRSRDRYTRTRKGSPPPLKRLTSPDRVSSKDKGAKDLISRPSVHPRDSSQTREGSDRRRRAPSGGPRRRPKSPRSPVDKEAARRNRTKMQQSPTRPIPSIFDNGPRPLSQPQRIPSFDAGNQGQPTNLSTAFPMHGMKASDVHGAHRPSRPSHLNTQHSYNTSPHYTPTSSHHGSPQSGSPFSQGRGGWNGQPQQYQGQPGYVLLQYDSPPRLTCIVV